MRLFYHHHIQQLFCVDNGQLANYRSENLGLKHMKQENNINTFF